MVRANREVDVAIVGASLAGCASAILMGRAGLRVALIDKHSDLDAYKRLCGHYIQASAVPVIERLGLAEAIEEAGGVRNGADVWTHWGVIAPPEPTERRPYGYSLRRSKLDPMIRSVASGTAGVDYRPGMEVVGLVHSGDAVSGVEIRDRQGRVGRLNARLVVGADGRNSSVARLARARERRSANERFCYMAYFTGVGLPEGSAGRLWVLDPDAAIASPNDDGLTLLAGFLHKERLPEFRQDRAGALRHLFETLPDGPSMEGAELVGKLVGYTDYGVIKRDAAPLAGVALVGDAALTADPLMAIGCGWALQSAEWLADAATAALVDGENVVPAVRRYQRMHRRRLGGHHRMLAAEARGHAMNPVQRLIFAAAAQDPRTAQRVHDYARRIAGPASLLSPRALARATRVRAGAYGVSRRWSTSSGLPQPSASSERP